jgi:hypothetical protein
MNLKNCCRFHNSEEETKVFRETLSKMFRIPNTKQIAVFLFRVNPPGEGNLWLADYGTRSRHAKTHIGVKTESLPSTTLSIEGQIQRSSFGRSEYQRLKHELAELRSSGHVVFIGERPIANFEYEAMRVLFWRAAVLQLVSDSLGRAETKKARVAYDGCPPPAGGSPVRSSGGDFPGKVETGQRSLRIHLQNGPHHLLSAVRL